MLHCLITVFMVNAQFRNKSISGPLGCNEKAPEFLRSSRNQQNTTIEPIARISVSIAIFLFYANTFFQCIPM